MRAFVFLAVTALAASPFAGEPSVADLVGRLKSPDATHDDWPPIIEAGKAAVPELRKLLADSGHSVRAAAAVLLYRLGEADALDTLDGVLDSKDDAARREAADALAAFVGGKAAFDLAAASGEALGTARDAWRSWWKANREKALATPPLSCLYGRVTGADPSSSLIATSLSARHGARQGMRLNVRRGDECVCLLDVIFATPAGSVGRIVALSERLAPARGDTCFWTKPKGG